jgi:hypothetical protein
MRASATFARQCLIFSGVSSKGISGRPAISPDNMMKIVTPVRCISYNGEYDAGEAYASQQGAYGLNAESAFDVEHNTYLLTVDDHKVVLLNTSSAPNRSGPYHHQTGKSRM